MRPNNSGTPQFVAILDFGAQYAQLIARRVRENHVYSEIVPCDISAKEIESLAPAAIIFSGGPASVYAEDAPAIDAGILSLGIPVLGFCYGQQIMAASLGGTVGRTDSGEYGPKEISRHETSQLLDGTPQTQNVWMSHRDSVTIVPEGFMITSTTDTCPVASMENVGSKLFATQFHPEVTHTEHGDTLLRNFLFNICHLEPSWTMDDLIERSVSEIKEQVGDGQVILGLSGGVDSAVTAALLHKAIGDQLTCVFVDHGFMRKGEPENIHQVFTEQFGIPLITVSAQQRYQTLLDNVVDPEEKRMIIGSDFWKIFFEEAKKLGDVTWLAQGTIYPDIIESGSRKTGSKGSTIKSHHNLIPFPEGVHFDLIEPLDHLFKDEVRALGLALGLPEEIVYRQPFPGPGLAIRIIGAVTPEKLHIVKEADAIVREELDAYNEALRIQTGVRDSEKSVWQYFAVLPDVKSVGVMGDERTYAYPVVLRAVESSDAMTADWAKLPHDLLSKISGRLVAEVSGINRVVYDITPKPPGTIEWE